MNHIQNLALWPSRDSGSPPPGPILAGHFVRNRDYACQRRHGARDWLLAFTKRGAGLFVVDGKPIQAIKNRIIILPPGRPHQYRSESEAWDFYWVHFLPDAQWREWAEGLVGLSRIDLSTPGVAQRLEQAFIRLLLDQDREGPVSRGLSQASLAEILLLTLRESGWEQRGEPDARFDQVLEALSADLGAKLSLARLSVGMGLSVSGFSHWFREKAGISPIRYRQRLRLRKAAELLSRTKASFTEIASELGFHSLFHFSNQFKAWYGVRPRDWRKREPASSDETGGPPTPS